ncbi:MAG: MFS transporter, partial [Firmicutes bacterium]|nr:MFS transporter [Bacillota bacterium]
MPSRYFIFSYVFFAFSIGLSWFVLAPLVPSLLDAYHVGLPAVLLLISLYGYAMVLLSLPVGWWSARTSVATILRWAVVLSAAGLLLRAFATDYALLVIGQMIAAAAYPLTISPIGSILDAAASSRRSAVTGSAIGLLFVGMAVGAFVGPHLFAALGLHDTLWLIALVNWMFGLNLWRAAGRLRKPYFPRHAPKHWVIGSKWWIVGFGVASISVMLGSVSSAALLHLHIPNATVWSGQLTALTFLGSGIGAVAFGLWGGRMASLRPLLSGLALGSWLLLLGIGLQLTGYWTLSPSFLFIGFFFFGALGNGWYALSLERAADAARAKNQAGLATAGYS